MKPTRVQIGEKAAQKFMDDSAEARRLRGEETVTIPLTLAEAVAQYLGFLAVNKGDGDVRLHATYADFCKRVEAAGGVTL